MAKTHTETYYGLNGETIVVYFETGLWASRARMYTSYVMEIIRYGAENKEIEMFSIVDFPLVKHDQIVYTRVHEGPKGPITTKDSRPIRPTRVVKA